MRARLLRALSGRLSETLSETGTRLAVEFTSSGESGGGIPLGGGLTLLRELDRFILGRTLPAVPDQSVRIEGVGEGEGIAKLGGSVYRIRWSPRRPADCAWRERFSLDGIRFPLTVRAWTPGDRIRLPYGTKKLKKLFLEARVPLGQRHRTPVLADAAGGILWVPEVVRSVDVPAAQDEGAFHIGITHADSD